MNDTPRPDHPYGRPVQITEGPFEGWSTWSRGADPFESLVGPFCYKQEGGETRTAFQPRRENLNGGGAVHGGCLMSFADFSLFAIAQPALGSALAVTLTCHCDFLSAGGLDGWIEARGDILRHTRSLVFVRGVLTQQARPVLAFSGTLKKIGA